MEESFQYLERKRLFKQLDRIKNVPLTLIVAPMGYGKTSMLFQYLQKNKLQNIWITLGQMPIQEQWLRNRIATEIASISEAISQKMQQIGISNSSNEENATSQFLTLLREKLFSEDFYLVLDDYQSYEGQKINLLLSKLAYEDIPGVHIVLISRRHINLPLEELRLKGYCALISQVDLIMSPEEMKELFALNGMHVDEQQFPDIYTYTDGWVAAARLLWQDYQDHGTLQSFGSIQRLLKESLYTKLSPEERKILYPFTCFAELSIEELDAVTDFPVIPSSLKALTEKIGFFHYNLQNHKYNIHTLLHCVVLESEDGDPHELYRRYASYQEKNKQYISALEYYDKAGCREEIFQILDSEYRFEIMQQIPDFLIAFFRSCTNPQELISHPYAILSGIYYMLLSANASIMANGIRFFAHAKDIYISQQNLSGKCNDLLGELYFVDSLNVFHNLNAATESLCCAWELRGGKASHIFSKRPYSYGVPNTLFMYHKEPGKLALEVASEIEYSHHYMKLIYNTHTSLDKFIHAEHALEIGEIKTARLYAAEALEKAIFQNQVCIVLSSYMVLMRSVVFQGKKHDFEQLTAECDHFIQHAAPYSSLLDTEYDLMCGYLYAVLGQLDKIPLWLRKRQFDKCNLIIRDSRNSCLIYSLYLCRKKHWTKLAANAEEMMLSFTGTRHIFSEIYAYIFYSIAHWYTGDTDKALSHLLKGLDLAEPDKIMMPFAEISEELLPILELAGTENSYAKEVSLFCSQWQTGMQSFKVEEYKEAVFTQREKDIMELLAQGYRNAEIGEKLHIARITVEKNLTAIYRKIGVSNRTSALNWYVSNRS